MLNYNEITPKKYIEFDNNVFEVVSSNISKKQQRRPVNQTKLKNAKTGKVTERTFQQSDKVKEAELGKFKAVFVYSKNEEVFFHTEGDPSDRFSLPLEILGGKEKFLKKSSVVEFLIQENDGELENRIIKTEIPIKIILKVENAPPNVKGNTAQGGEKPVELETGAVVNAPLFIKNEDKIVVNTETGEYVERA